MALKVVGGMIWCISICNFDIDVDLLFQENATIGQKMYVKILNNNYQLLSHKLPFPTISNNTFINFV